MPSSPVQTPAPSEPRLGGWERAVFCLVLASAALIIGGYNYALPGTDQIQQIPLIMRGLDPSFIQDDFFINSSMVFGPRYFYIKALSLLARFVPLPVLMLFFTWACYVSIAFITFAAARRIFRGDELAAMLACGLIFGVESLMIGENGHLLEPYLIPRLAARPLILLGFWLGFSGRPLAGGPFTALGALIHPLESVGAGLIGLGAQGLYLLGRIVKNPEHNRRADLLDLLKTGGTAIFLVLFIYLVFLVRQDKSLDDAAFIHYWAVFRHPHHYIPSTWPASHFLAGAAFAGALGLALRWAVQEGRMGADMAARTGWVILATAGLCLGGYLFVEVIPTRIWTMAQTYRFLFVLKWLGLIVLGGSAAALLRGPARPGSGRTLPERLPGLLVLAGSFRNQPFMVLWAHLLELLRRSGGPSGRARPWLLAFLGLAGAAVLGALFGYRLRELFLVFLFTAMALWFLKLDRSWWKTGLPLLGLALLVGVGFWGGVPKLALEWKGQAEAHSGPPDEMSHFPGSPALLGPPARLSAWVRENTGERSVFIVPPMFGKFRITARRAVVVDFKCIPYTDSAIREWADRLEDCYGPIRQTGFRAVAAMENRYAGLDDRRLAGLARKYKAAYAVLYRRTPTGLPVLYDRGPYKVVRLPGA